MKYRALECAVFKFSTKVVMYDLVLICFFSGNKLTSTGVLGSRPNTIKNGVSLMLG